MKIKEVRKFITRFQKLSFGGDPHDELLNQHSRYDEQGHLLSEMRIDEFGHEENHTFAYNDTGKLVEQHLSADEGETSETIRFAYDDKGRLIRQQKIYGADPGEYTEYAYAEHEQPVAIHRYDSDGEPESDESVEYNARTLPVVHIRSGHGDQPTDRTTFTYNEQDLPVSRMVYDKAGQLLQATEFEYNDRNESIRITERNGTGKMLSEIRSAYDDQGNITERIIRDYHPRTLQFTYDELNNCTAESVHDENGNLLQRSTYTFDDESRPLTESHYHMDVNRGGGPANSHCRYEYEMW